MYVRVETKKPRDWAEYEAAAVVTHELQPRHPMMIFGDDDAQRGRYE